MIYIYKIISIISNNYWNSFFDLLIVLDNNTRTEIYIGLTGLMIAIVVFIAEIITKKKTDIEKQFITEKTKIKYTFTISILLFVLLLISIRFNSSYVKSKEIFFLNINGNIYILIQLIINIFIIVFIYFTCYSFFEVIKLTIDNAYYSNEFGFYMNNYLIETEKMAKEYELNSINKEKTKSFEQFINNNNDLMSFKTFNKDYYSDNYDIIYSSKNGIIKDINIEKLESIIAAFEKNNNLQYSDYVSPEAPVVVFCSKIGEIITTSDPICYCLKEYKKFFEEIDNCIIFGEYSNIEKELEIAFSYIFNYGKMFNKKGEFDVNNYLLDTYKFIRNNKLVFIKKNFYQELEMISRDIYKDINKSNSFLRFLNYNSYDCFQTNDFENFKQINNMVLFLYIQQLLFKETDKKQVVYNFCNNYFIYNYYSYKNKGDLSYYEELLSSLLYLIYILIKEKYFDSIPVIFDNIYFDNKYLISEEISNKDIIDIQFSFGIVKCLILWFEKEDTQLNNKDNYKIFKQLLDWTENSFIGHMRIWDVIKVFKNYYNKISSVQKVYDSFDFTNHDYKNHWGGWLIDNNSVLRELIYSFDLYDDSLDKNDFDDISKDDMYFYKNILNIFDNDSKSKYEEKLDLKYNNKIVIELLKQAYENSREKVNEFNKTNDLDKNKLKEFKDIIINKLNSNNIFVEKLKEYGKVITTEKNIKNVLGINNIINRDIFFANVNYDILKDDIVRAFDNGIYKKYVKILESISVLSNNGIEKELSKINQDDYVLITNNYFIFKNSNSISNIEKIILPYSNYSYLIKKENLPEIEYCKFDSSFSKRYIKNHVFYKLDDLSNKNKLRESIINSTDWLSSKGDKYQQDEFLKERCRLQIYLSIRINKIKDSKAISFKNDDF
ncbi:MAG: hypothetical protein J5970_00325 [Bacilli bacterium]|nr:hypothetical protein [Bacilli bacterium]